MRLHASETQCAEGENRLISGYVGRHVSHHGGTHSLQLLLLPRGRVDGAQPADAGGDELRDSEVPRAMDSGRRFQHGT